MPTHNVFGLAMMIRDEGTPSNRVMLFKGAQKKHTGNAIPLIVPGSARYWKEKWLHSVAAVKETGIFCHAYCKWWLVPTKGPSIGSVRIECYQSWRKHSVLFWEFYFNMKYLLYKGIGKVIDHWYSAESCCCNPASMHQTDEDRLLRELVMSLQIPHLKVQKRPQRTVSRKLYGFPYKWGQMMD